MEQIDMTKYLPCTARLVGGTLYILDGEGRVQRRLDPLQTAIEWFQMSNDAFYARYGVNWIPKECALPGFVDSKNEEKTERNAGYLVVSHSGGGMLRQGTRKGIRRTPANRGMRAHWVVKGLDISEDVCHGMCP